MSLRIKAIIALMSLALLGLVFIQFYWIDNAISLKEDEFRQKVNLALRQVVKDLEKKEAVERFRHHQQTRRLMHKRMMQHKKQLMKLRQRGAGSTSASDQFKSQLSEQGPGQVIIREQRSPDSNTRIISREFSGPNYTGTSVQIDINVNQDGDAVQLNQLDSSMEIKVDERAEMIDEIFYDLMQNDMLLNINERVRAEVLDSLLHRRLSDMMIETEVKYGVFDYFGRMVKGMGHEKDLEVLRSSVYKARLFPNDFFGDPFFISLTFPNQKGFLIGSMWFTLTISTLFILLIIGAFSYTIHVIQNQKQLSLIKNDFISNMTHELKTPISTISLACEALSDETMSADKARKNKFLQMISQENNRLGGLVENVLKSSIWDKSDFRMHREECDMHQLISDIAESASIQIEQKGGRLSLDLKAALSTVVGDPVHLTNVLNNLIDNAVKYSGDEIDIAINTINEAGIFKLNVSDKGIGISREHQKKIFEKFYRVPKGNLHNVKGFGLGLNYVMNVIKNHSGSIEVKSSEGKGSTFTIQLPLKESSS